jgi:hypothetical protein
MSSTGVLAEPGEGTMTTFGNLFFWEMLGLLTLLAVMALIVGWWVYAIVAVAVGGCFAFAGPFVLGRRCRVRRGARSFAVAVRSMARWASNRAGLPIR